jgi:beta-glucosidase
MRSKQPSSRTLLVAAMAGLFIALGVAMPADSAVTPHAAINSNVATPIYLNRSYSFAERAADLVSRMTLAQKASQMDSSYAPAIPSLGVPSGAGGTRPCTGSRASNCSTTPTRPR